MDNNDYINALLNERAGADQHKDSERVKQIEAELSRAGYSGDYSTTVEDVPGWQRTPPVNTAAGVIVDADGKVVDTNNPDGTITANFQDRAGAPVADNANSSNEAAAAVDEANAQASNDTAPQERAVASPSRTAKRS